MKRFHEELSLPYPLVSDFRDRIFVANYGIYNEKYGTPQRRTYVIDGQGVIRHVVVNDKDMQAHSIDALDALRRL